MSGQYRILHLVYLRFWSAIAWHALGLAKALEVEGHRCWIAGATGSPIVKKAGEGGDLSSRVLELDWLRPWNYLTTIGRLRRFMKQERIDLVFVHTGSGHLETHLARTGLPTGIVRVRADARSPRLDPGKRWLYRHGTDLLAVSGAYMISDQLEGSLPMERIVHLPPGINNIEIEQNPQLSPEVARELVCSRHGINSKRALIGIIGRLSPVKGHRLLIQAAGALAREGLDFTLIVVGAEKKVKGEDLFGWAREAGIEDRVIYTGHVADPLVYAAALDIGVVCSLGSEAVSRSALEFMSVGVPVVASRVGILPEVVGCDDQLVPADDAAALTRALSRLLREKALRHQARETGSERLKRLFSCQRLGEQAVSITQAGIDHRRRP